jgi:hypothetical protein
LRERERAIEHNDSSSIGAILHENTAYAGDIIGTRAIDVSTKSTNVSRYFAT